MTIQDVKANQTGRLSASLGYTPVKQQGRKPVVQITVTGRNGRIVQGKHRA